MNIVYAKHLKPRNYSPEFLLVASRAQFEFGKDQTSIILRASVVVGKEERQVYARGRDEANAMLNLGEAMARIAAGFGHFTVEGFKLVPGPA